MSEGLYHADGQQLDEVFEDGSFRQSRMYQRGVGCTHCHDAHSGKPKLAGNALCLQCHKRSQELESEGYPGALRTGRSVPSNRPQWAGAHVGQEARSTRPREFPKCKRYSKACAQLGRADSAVRSRGMKAQSITPALSSTPTGQWSDSLTSGQMNARET